MKFNFVYAPISGIPGRKHSLTDCPQFHLTKERIETPASIQRIYFFPQIGYNTIP